MMWFFIFIGLMSCTEKLVGASCPIVMNPPVVVVQYKGNFSANCKSLTQQTDGMGWESVTGGTDLEKDVTNVSLYITSVVYWDLRPMCYINFLDGDQCENYLSVTVYKTMDSVSLSELSETGPMMAGTTYHMQCDVTNVAPARNLTVYWHKGNKIFHTYTSNSTSPHPVNVTSVLNVVVDRADNGSQIWCEAQLIFSQVGLSLPSMKSRTRTWTVLYPPEFANHGNETVEVAPQSQLILNCTATGNPKPVYSWQYPQILQQTNQNLNDSEPIVAPSFHVPGTYSCTASNSQGTRTKYFTVIEAAGNRTTFVAIVAGFALLGVALLVAGPFIVTQNGAFSFNKGSYQPAASGPV